MSHSSNRRTHPKTERSESSSSAVSNLASHLGVPGWESSSSEGIGYITMTPSTTDIAKLLPEVLLTILENLHNDGREAILPSLLVNKEWNLLATRVLYKDIFINHHSVEAFVTPAPTQRFEQVRSLMLSTGDPGSFYNGKSSTPPEILQSIKPHLCEMHNLVSFSFGAYSIIAQNPSEYLSTLGVLLRSLPPSFEYLELVFPNQHSSFEFESIHLCSILAEILPRLRSLRLFDTTICPALFDNLHENCDQLTNIVIQTRPGWVQNSCPFFNNVPDILRINQFLAAARRSVEAGRFPAAENFLFYCQRLYDILPTTESFHCLYRSAPYQKEVEYAGHPKELRRLVEGPARWVRAKNDRARRSAALNSKAHFAWLSPLNLMVVDAGSIRGRGPRAVLLRRRELRSGRKLLGVRTERGLHVPDYPQYDVPEDEGGQ